METPVRLWRTDDEGELVLDSDPKAKILAYGEDDEVSEADEAAAKKALKSVARKGDESGAKKAEEPANKQRASANKSASKKS